MNINTTEIVLNKLIPNPKTIGFVKNQVAYYLKEDEARKQQLLKEFTPVELHKINNYLKKIS